MKHKLVKTLLIIIGIIIVSVLLIIIFISPITKRLVEKYDEQYTGRQITMDWAYVNPFTGYMYFSNLKFHELKSDSLFFTAKSVSSNIALLKLLSKTIEISQLTLDRPKGFVIQKNKDFNFDDLIKKFTVKKTDTKTSKVHFNILNIKIKNGEFHYSENHYPINYYIKNVNIESTGKSWDSDTIAAHFSFLSGIGKGDVKGNFTINLKNKDYRMAVVAHKFDLNIIEQYLNGLTNYGSFTANLDADLKSIGNFSDVENVTNSGMIAINDFHFGINPNDDYASFDKLAIAIKEMSPKKHIYSYDSFTLSHPFFNYERYDKLDNLQTIFGEKESNFTNAKANTAQFNLIIEIVKYIKLLAKNFFRSDYKINHLAVYNGNIRFNDYSLTEKFSVQLNPLFVNADSIDKKHNQVNVFLKSDIKPYGKLTVTLSINPKESSDFNLQYHLQRLPVALFNPYMIANTSYPLDMGTIELNGAWKVRNGMVKSNNHLVIVDPRVAKRVINKGAKWLPVWLVMAFVRESSNVIDYQIPITGNLKNPKFNFHDVLTDLLTNIIVKPATTLYRIQVKNTEIEIEKSLSLKWEMRQNTLKPLQEKFINKMVDFLIKTPDASIMVQPQVYELKEKEYILFYEAKKKYFMAINHKNAHSFTVEDSVTVNKMSVRNSLFIQYLNKHTKGDLLFTIQAKCAQFIGSEFITTKFNRLNKERENAFRLRFKESGVEKRIKIYKGENVIPYYGFSFYKITYKGEFPTSLLKAYRQMNEFNNEAPRKKYLKERKKNVSDNK